MSSVASQSETQAILNNAIQSELLSSNQRNLPPPYEDIDIVPPNRHPLQIHCHHHLMLKLWQCQRKQQTYKINQVYQFWVSSLLKVDLKKKHHLLDIAVFNIAYTNTVNPEDVIERVVKNKLDDQENVSVNKGLLPFDGINYRTSIFWKQARSTMHTR